MPLLDPPVLFSGLAVAWAFIVTATLLAILYVLNESSRLLARAVAQWCFLHHAAHGTLTIGSGVPKRAAHSGGRTMADLSIDCDYPLSITNITDRAGNPAAIDGTPTFVLDNEAVGSIVVTAGDPRVADGTILLVTGTAVGAGANLECHVDPNLNPEITDHAVIARVQVVLTGGVATAGTLAIGDGIPKA